MKINILAITPLIMTVLITMTSTGVMARKPLVEADKREVYQGYLGLIEQLNDEVEFPESIMKLSGDTITLQNLLEHFYVDGGNLDESDMELKEHLTELFNSAKDENTESITKKKFLNHLADLYYDHGLNKGGNPESRLKDWIKQQGWKTTSPDKDDQLP
ncbi:hypothetical protein IWQ61_003608 [Dispira simplex]|nr:hypothetical protein IWQ61_003608 [Dispira simplex]